MKPLDAPAVFVAPRAMASAMGGLTFETMLASLLTLPAPPTQPAFKPPYQPLQLYAGAAIPGAFVNAGAFVYLGNGRSVANAEPDSAAATTIPPKIRFIEISSNLSAARAAPPCDMNLTSEIRYPAVVCVTRICGLDQGERE